MNGSMKKNAPSRNIKLVIAYNGAAYHGWQRQKDGIDTVQQRIETAVVRVVKHPVAVHGAGRTDAGVHATGQVAHFRTTNLSVPLLGLRRAMNSRLPKDILVRSAEEVSDDFHASLSAVGKTYRYRIRVAPQRDVLQAGQVWHYPRHALDMQRMCEAANALLGEHDFAGFATSGTETLY